MKRILKSLLIVLLSAGAVYAAGSWATNNWTYKPQLTTQGTTDYTQFNLSQDKIDTEMQRVRNLLSTSVKTPQMYGAVADGTTDDTVAIQAAATAAGGKVLYFPPATGYKVTAAITLSVANTIVMGDDKTPITQATAATNLFTVSASGVEFRNLKLVGVDTGDTTTDLVDASAIKISGTSASPKSGIKIFNCDISGFFYAIQSPWTSIDIAYNTLYDNMRCIDTSVPFADRNLDSTDLVQKITYNRCEVSFGKLATSRPINISHLGSADVIGNYCRGAGIAIESYIDNSVITTPSNIRIIGNDCDTGISTGGTHVLNNTIDYSKAPAGRGYQSDWANGIENLMPGQLIQGNVIRNTACGVLIMFPRCRVIGNEFYGCGYQVGNPAPPDFYTYAALFVVSGTGTNASIYMNCVIDGNTFESTLSNVGVQDVYDIYISAGAQASINGVVISNNISKNCMVPSIASYKPIGCSIIGNTIVDSNTGENAAGSRAIHEIDISSNIYYLDNTVISTIGGTGFGPAYGLVPGPDDIVGVNNYVGMRTTGMYLSNFPLVIAPQVTDGEGIIPGPYADNATARAAGWLKVGTVYKTATGALMSVFTP